MAGRGNYKGMYLLVSLKRRTELFLIGSIVCIIFVALAYAFRMEEVLINAFIIADIVFIGILLFMITLSYRKIMLAKLIIENRIVHLKQTQGVLSNEDETDPHDYSDKEVFISCFGLMMDNKIIKFNLDGILLKSVELNEQCMTITFGTTKKNKKIRIEHAPMTVQDMIRISEKIRYETGVIPVLVDEK